MKAILKGIMILAAAVFLFTFLMAGCADRGVKPSDQPPPQKTPNTYEPIPPKEKTDTFQTPSSK